MDSTAEPAPEESPMIVSVYSLTEGIVTDAIFTSKPEQNINFDVKKEAKIESPQKKQQMKLSKVPNEPNISPKEYLKQFNPFGKAKSDITIDSIDKVPPIVMPSLSVQNYTPTNLGTNFQNTFRPRVAQVQFPRPTLPPPNPFNPVDPRFGSSRNFPGPGPTPPHVLIRGNLQSGNSQFSNQNQLTNTRPLAPHQLTQMNPAFNLSNPVVIQTAYAPQSYYPPEAKPFRAFTFPHPQITQSPADQDDEPMQVDPSFPTTSRPLAPHELVNRPGMLGTQQIPNYQKLPTTSHSSQPNLVTFHPQSIECKIVNFLRLCAPNSQSALQIGQAIGNKRKKVDAAANRLLQENVVFIANNSLPHSYTLNSMYFGSSYDLNSAYPTGKSALKRQISIVESSSSPKSKRIDKTSQEFNMDPVSLLAHLCNKDRIALSYHVLSNVQRGGRSSFVLQVRVGDKMYTSSASNKKDAKKDVSDLALKDMLVDGHSNADLSTISKLGPLNTNNFHSDIAAKSQEFFLHVISQVPEAQAGRKVFACIILETPENFYVVSVGSGTRCCNGSVISCSGDVIHDTHAEIIARRALIRFLMLQLKEYFASNCLNDQLFTPSSYGKHRIKDGFKFHLYISHAPCGDSAIFVRSEADHADAYPDGSHRPIFNHKNQGLLRTKIEEGEGTLPCESSRQTVDGILRGARLRVMSCSDKVGKWNVLGFQGALLSHFIDPIYMSSLTLGTLYHHGHLSRAVCCRFAQPELTVKLKPPYHVVHPVLGSVPGKEEIKRHVGKTSTGSLNWTPSDTATEFLDGGTGRLASKFLSNMELANSKSRLCKSSLLKDFREICQLSKRNDLLGLNYKNSKASATSYQEAKMVLFEFCKKSGLGDWSHLPTEVDEFDK